MDQAARQWNVSNTILLDDCPHLKHHLKLTYEELTANPTVVYKSVIHFLELTEIETGFQKQEFRIHGTTSRIRNMNEESVRLLSSYDREIIHTHCSETMKRLGYE
jgi:hypothetical protein